MKVKVAVEIPEAGVLKQPGNISISTLPKKNVRIIKIVLTSTGFVSWTTKRNCIIESQRRHENWTEKREDYEVHHIICCILLDSCMRTTNLACRCQYLTERKELTSKNKFWRGSIQMLMKRQFVHFTELFQNPCLFSKKVCYCIAPITSLAFEIVH